MCCLSVAFVVDLLGAFHQRAHCHYRLILMQKSQGAVLRCSSIAAQTQGWRLRGMLEVERRMKCWRLNGGGGRVANRVGEVRGRERGGRCGGEKRRGKSGPGEVGNSWLLFFFFSFFL